jgi:hypothetical protein
LLHPRPSAETARPVLPNARLIIVLAPWLPLGTGAGSDFASDKCPSRI